MALDMTTIETVLGLASTAVSVTGKAASTVETMKKIFSGDKAPDNKEAMALLNNLAVELTSANMMNVDLSKALRELNEQLRREDQFDKERTRYQLFKTNQGDFVFKLRADMANHDPEHFICPACLNKDRLIAFIAGDGDYKHCQVDKSHVYKFSDTPIRSNRFDSGGWV